jgi:hypothetical protein
MAKRLRIDISELQGNLDDFDRRANAAISRTFEFQRPKSEARMKTTATWTDRTGNARNGLFAAVKPDSALNNHELLLSHSVPYGIWLEVAHGSQYAIVIPEILLAGDDIMRLLARLFEQMARGR